jgi:hypothetical protein
MNATMTAEHTVMLTADERLTLRDILEEVLKETEIEWHRTEAFGAKEVVRTKAARIESLLRKVREAGQSR